MGKSRQLHVETDQFRKNAARPGMSIAQLDKRMQKILLTLLNTCYGRVTCTT